MLQTDGWDCGLFSHLDDDIPTWYTFDCLHTGSYKCFICNQADRTIVPTKRPTTAMPTHLPSNQPTVEPTNQPTTQPTNHPTFEPTKSPVPLFLDAGKVQCFYSEIIDPAEHTVDLWENKCETESFNGNGELAIINKLDPSYNYGQVEEFVETSFIRGADHLSMCVIKEFTDNPVCVRIKRNKYFVHCVFCV